jgi:glycine cleavage system H protein
MSKIPEQLHYSEEHEYVKPTEDPGVVVIGITDYAQGELGDVVYVDLPSVGASLAQMDVFGTIEAVKAVSELFCPVSGEVVDINEAVESDPGLVNKDPYGEGWMIRLQLTKPDQLAGLLTADDYRAHVGEG